MYMLYPVEPSDCVEDDLTGLDKAEGGHLIDQNAAEPCSMCMRLGH